MEFQEYLSSWSQVDACGWADGWTDATKLVAALHSFVSMPHSDQVVLNRAALN